VLVGHNHWEGKLGKRTIKIISRESERIRTGKEKGNTVMSATPPQKSLHVRRTYGRKRRNQKLRSIQTRRGKEKPKKHKRGGAIIFGVQCGPGF